MSVQRKPVDILLRNYHSFLPAKKLSIKQKQCHHVFAVVLNLRSSESTDFLTINAERTNQ